MPEMWFISDTHFGHKNIIEYEKEFRNFNTVEEMNESIIERWNSVVNHDDIVYHLGDFAFGRKNIAIAERLKGKKILIMGNHDSYPVGDYSQYFHKLFGVHHLHRFILSHVPVHPSNLESRWFLNIHGHLHSRRVKMPNLEKVHDGFHSFSEMMEDPRYFNVSCEQNNLTPIHYDVIKERLNEL